MVKGKKTADPALKYYFEMLGLPLTASEAEVLDAYEYFQKEQGPGQYTPGSADQKKAEEKQAELKFAFDKLAKWFKDNPDSNASQGEPFRFDGNIEQWKQHQSLQWSEKLKEYRAQETEVWTKIHEERKQMRLFRLLKRTKITAAIICSLAISGESWHSSWNKQFRHIQSENLAVQAFGDFRRPNGNPQELHDSLIKQARDLKDEWNKDDEASQSAITWTWIISVLVAVTWLPKRAWDEIAKAILKPPTKKKVA